MNDPRDGLMDGGVVIMMIIIFVIYDKRNAADEMRLMDDDERLKKKYTLPIRVLSSTRITRTQKWRANRVSLMSQLSAS